MNWCPQMKHRYLILSTKMDSRRSRRVRSTLVVLLDCPASTTSLERRQLLLRTALTHDFCYRRGVVAS